MHTTANIHSHSYELARDMGYVREKGRMRQGTAEMKEAERKGRIWLTPLGNETDMNMQSDENIQNNNTKMKRK